MSSNFDAHELKQIADALNTFPEVTWDRYMDDGQDFIAYGWIEREQDSYKDFMVLVIDDVDFSYWYITSSAKYSQAFHNRINEDPAGHNKCRRIEHMFPDVKAIRLKEKAKED